jgi:hypothetical protein
MTDNQVSKFMREHPGCKVPPSIADCVAAIMRRRLELRAKGLDWPRIQARAAKLGVDPLSGKPLGSEPEPAKPEKPKRGRKKRRHAESVEPEVGTARYTAEGVLEARAE